MVLLQGPVGWRFLASEAPLHCQLRVIRLRPPPRPRFSLAITGGMSAGAPRAGNLLYTRARNLLSPMARNLFSLSLECPEGSKRPTVGP